MSIDTSRPFPEISDSVISVSQVPGLLARARAEIRDDQDDFPSTAHKVGALDRLDYIEGTTLFLEDGAIEAAELMHDQPVDLQVRLGTLTEVAAAEHIELLRVLGVVTGFHCDYAGHIAQSVLERLVLADIMNDVPR